MDSAIFLNSIPATHQYLLTMQSAFWSVGQATAALHWLAANCEVLLPVQSRCDLPFRRQPGLALHLLGSSVALRWPSFPLRLFFRGTRRPSYLLSKRGLDQQAVDVVQKIAGARNKTTTWLTISHFEAVDAELDARSRGADIAPDSQGGIVQRRLEKFTPSKLRALFSTPRIALSTSLMLFLWCSIGMAYPLYNSFIPIYLENKGVNQGDSSLNTTYRNYAIQAVCGIPASILGGFTCRFEEDRPEGHGYFCLSRYRSFPLSSPALPRKPESSASPALLRSSKTSSTGCSTHTLLSSFLRQFAGRQTAWSPCSID